MNLITRLLCPYGRSFTQQKIDMWIKMPEKVIKLQRLNEIKIRRLQHLEKGIKGPRGQEQGEV